LSSAGEHHLTALDNLLGKLTIVDKTGGSRQEQHDGSQLYLSPPKSLGTIAGDKFVHGVALIDHSLYVVREKSAEVEVYDLTTLHQTSTLKVHFMIGCKM